MKKLSLRWLLIWLIENKSDFEKLKDIYKNDSFALKTTDLTLNVFLWYVNDVLDEEEKIKIKSCIDFAYDKVIGDDSYRHYVSSKILESMEYSKKIKLKSFSVDSFSLFLLTSFASILMTPIHKTIFLKFFSSYEILNIAFSEYPFAVVHKQHKKNIKVVLPDTKDANLELYYGKIMQSIVDGFDNITYSEYKKMICSLYAKEGIFKTRLFNIKKNILTKSIVKDSLTQKEQSRIFDCIIFDFLTEIYEENDKNYNIAINKKG